MNDSNVEGTGQPGIPRPGSQLGDLQNQAVGANRVLPRRHELRGVIQICLWPRNPISIQSFWGRLRALLNSDIFDSIEKIVRVRQRSDGRQRFDIFVKRQSYAALYAQLADNKATQAWWVKTHEYYLERKHFGNDWDSIADQVNKPAENFQEAHPCILPQKQLRNIKLATWNIRSISGKRDEIGLYLKSSGISVLALQETLRSEDKYVLCLGGYQVFESPANSSNKEGKRGLALCISDRCPSYELGDCSPFVLGTQTLIGVERLIIINVYIPPKGNRYRREAIRDLRRVLSRSLASTPDAKVIVMGDFNIHLDDMPRFLLKIRFPLALVPCGGNPKTYHRRSQWSAIDHMVVSEALLPSVKRCKVNRSWDLSDHWPLECFLRSEHLAHPPPVPDDSPPRLNIPKLRDAQESIANHNMWCELENYSDSDSLSDVAEKFEEVSWAISEDAGCKRDNKPNLTRPTYRLSRLAKRAISRRLKAYKRWVYAKTHGASAEVCSQYEQQYSELKAIASAQKRTSSKISWAKFIARGAKQLTANDPKLFWVWINQVTHRGKSASLASVPIQKLNGSGLAFSPVEKLNEWFTYYTNLLADSTGHSCNSRYWTCRLPGPLAPPVDSLNVDITWGEINRALKVMKNGKAPGSDGIPTEFLKLAYEPDITADYDGPPSTLLGSTLLRILTLMWDKGHIPGRWNDAQVVSIFKKGDKTAMENYRGISLLTCVVKVLTLVIMTRLKHHLESTNWFCREQAGFRSLEECVAHSCALYEILRRRQIRNKRTYAVFIDFKKAYDLVPISALFRKLELLGVHGKALGFFQALYSNATIRVRTPYGTSPSTPIKRGLRQGCNASPLLFDIFINDIFDECRHLGVEVYGARQDATELGLLFADDVVILCPSLPRLKRVLRLLSKWASRHEMQLCVPKCGVMGIGEDAMNTLRSARDVNPEFLSISGTPVPLVEDYTYLGLKFTYLLDLDSMAQDRALKGERTLRSLQPVITSPDIPLYIRVTIVKAVLIPVLAYGGELWGMNDLRSRKPQKVLSDALRLLLRISAKSSITSTCTLSLELGIPPIHITVTAARARAYRKYPRLRTTIASLFQNKPKGLGSQTWISGSYMWLCRFCPESLQQDLSPTDAHALVKERSMSRYRATAKSKTTKTHIESNFEKTNDYLKVAPHYPSLSRGFNWLSRLRVGAFWTARRYCKIGWLPQQYLTLCPFCNSEGSGETVEHMLLSCSRWNRERSRHITRPLQGHQYIWENLLGGSKLNSGLSLRTLRQLWLPRQAEFQEVVDLQAQLGDNDDPPQLPLCAQVACFLQTIVPIRQRILGNIGLNSDVPRADAANGMADEVDNLDLGPLDPDPPD